jgi:hypothetical protein
MDSGQSEKLETVGFLRHKHFDASTLHMKSLGILTMETQNVGKLSPIEQANFFVGLPTPDVLLGVQVLAKRLGRINNPEFLAAFLPQVPPRNRPWATALRMYLQSRQWDSRTTQEFVFQGLSTIRTAESSLEKHWVHTLASVCFDRLRLSGQADATWASILEEISSRPARR